MVGKVNLYIIVFLFYGEDVYQKYFIGDIDVYQDYIID